MIKLFSFFLSLVLCFSLSSLVFATDITDIVDETVIEPTPTPVVDTVIEDVDPTVEDVVADGETVIEPTPTPVVDTVIEDVDPTVEDVVADGETVIDPTPTPIVETVIEYVFLENDDPTIWDKPLDEYTPTEGYLFLLFAIALVTLLFKFISYTWLF